MVDNEQADNLANAPHIDNVEIIEFLGKGAMSLVYKARQKQLDRIVAVKVLSKQALRGADWDKRFQNEAKLTSTLDHPNIVKTISFGLSADGQPYLLMEYLKGLSLADELKQNGRLSLQKFQDIFLPVLSALGLAHQQGLIHRDIKPQNIMLCWDDTGATEAVKLVDFGIAKVIAQAETSSPKLTKSGSVIGSPNYMSPEQCQDKPLDGRSDLYSIACVMYESLCGEPPFSADSILELLQKHSSQSPPTVADLNKKIGIRKELANVILWGLAKDPASRPQTAAEFGSKLAAALEQMTLDRVPRLKQAVSISKPAGNWQIIGLLVTFCLLLLIAAIVWKQQHKSGAGPEADYAKAGSTKSEIPFSRKLALVKMKKLMISGFDKDACDIGIACLKKYQHADAIPILAILASLEVKQRDFKAAREHHLQLLKLVQGSEHPDAFLKERISSLRSLDTINEEFSNERNALQAEISAESQAGMSPELERSKTALREIDKIKINSGDWLREALKLLDAERTDSWAIDTRADLLLQLGGTERQNGSVESARNHLLEALKEVDDANNLSFDWDHVCKRIEILSSLATVENTEQARAHLLGADKDISELERARKSSLVEGATIKPHFDLAPRLPDKENILQKRVLLETEFGRLALRCNDKQGAFICFRKALNFIEKVDGNHDWKIWKICHQLECFETMIRSAPNQSAKNLAIEEGSNKFSRVESVYRCRWYNLLAEEKRKQGSYKEAEKYLRTMIDLGKDDDDWDITAMRALGRILHEQKQDHDAKILFENAVKLARLRQRTAMACQAIVEESQSMPTERPPN